jgi:hypothetical protein
MNSTRLGPYGAWAPRYAENGIFTIPLPPNSKAAPPVGYTGRGHKTPSLAQVERWATPGVYAQLGRKRYETCHGNIAWVLPGDAEAEAHGLDVDAYPPKDGAKALAELERLLGHTLVPTWRITSRGGISGIRIYDVPAGLKWPGDLHGVTGFHGIEVIQSHHRYVILPPSIHDETGEPYGWYTSDNELMPVGKFLDSAEEFAGAGDDYVELLTSGERQPAHVPADQMSRGAKSAWLATRPGGPPCADMASAASRACDRVAGAWTGGIHDAALSGAMLLLRLAADGHAGVSEALGELRGAFLTARHRARRGVAEAAAEWGRIVGMGIPKATALAQAEGTARTACDCAEFEAARARSAGMAERLVTAGWSPSVARYMTRGAA